MPKLKMFNVANMSFNPIRENLWKISEFTVTLYVLKDSSFYFDAINLRWSIVYIEGSQVIISK